MKEDVHGGGLQDDRREGLERADDLVGMGPEWSSCSTIKVFLRDESAGHKLKAGSDIRAWVISPSPLGVLLEGHLRNGNVGPPHLVSKGIMKSYTCLHSKQ